MSLPSPRFQSSFSQLTLKQLSSSTYYRLQDPPSSSICVKNPAIRRTSRLSFFVGRSQPPKSLQIFMLCFFLTAGPPKQFNLRRQSSHTPDQPTVLIRGRLFGAKACNSSCYVFFFTQGYEPSACDSTLHERKSRPAQPPKKISLSSQHAPVL